LLQDGVGVDRSCDGQDGVGWLNVLSAEGFEGSDRGTLEVCGPAVGCVAVRGATLVRELLGACGRGCGDVEVSAERGDRGVLDRECESMGLPPQGDGEAGRGDDRGELQEVWARVGDGAGRGLGGPKVLEKRVRETVLAVGLEGGAGAIGDGHRDGGGGRVGLQDHAKA